MSTPCAGDAANKIWSPGPILHRARVLDGSAMQRLFVSRKAPREVCRITRICATILISRRSPGSQFRLRTILLSDILPEVSILPMPYNIDPSRGSEESSAIGKGVAGVLSSELLEDAGVIASIM